MQIENGFHDRESQAVALLGTAFIFAEIRLPKLFELGLIADGKRFVIGQGGIFFRCFLRGLKQIKYRPVELHITGIELAEIEHLLNKVVDLIRVSICRTLGKSPGNLFRDEE